MRVAGIGFRRDAPLAALRQALAVAGGGKVDLLATASDKADAPQFVALAHELRVPVRAVLPGELAKQDTLTQSSRMRARYATGSLAEAAALAAAGPGARLLAARSVSKDGMATAAIAEGLSP